MFRAFHEKRKCEGGFTLIELMIVVAIVGILAAIAVPNFIAYRNKSRIAASVGSIESVRAAIASYAADSAGNSFPGSIANYSALVAVVNNNGASLNSTATVQGFNLRNYTGLDSPADGVFEDYTMSFTVYGIESGDTGSVIFVSPGGIAKLSS